MSNTIKLKGLNSYKRLAGNDFGNLVYNEQIKNKIKLNDKNVLVFPDTIEGVAMSFIEGMLIAMEGEISRKDFFKHFEIKGNEKLEKKFIDVIRIGDK